MSFMDQKPFTVTPEWTECFRRRRDGGLRCAWCGHRFEVGDTARLVYTNGGGEECRGISGNPFICQSCDGPRDVVLARLRQMRAESEKYWWFLGP